MNICFAEDKHIALSTATKLTSESQEMFLLGNGLRELFGLRVLMEQVAGPELLHALTMEYVGSLEARVILFWPTQVSLPGISLRQYE